VEKSIAKKKKKTMAEVHNYHPITLVSAP